MSAEALAYLSIVDPERDRFVLNQLEPKTAELMSIHMDTTKNWVPDQLLPLTEAKSHDKHKGWPPPATDIPKAVGSALFVNTLTEDNLPEYFDEITSHARMLDPNHTLRKWVKRWKYEESRHGRVMDGYLAATRLIDLDELESAREVLMSNGVVPHAPTGLQLLAYTTIQEKATQIAHKNTAACLNMVDKGGGNVYNGTQIMATVARDEGYHHRFYGGLLKEALTIDPTMALTALAREIVDFNMPGKDIPGFARHAARISRERIYGEAELLDQVLKPTLQLLEFDKVDVDRLLPDGQRAHEVIVGSLGVLSARVAKRNYSVQKVS